jgi:predicted RNase H-like HicB family nuclease
MAVMRRFTVEMIPDPELGGFTARVPDIPAYGEGDTEDEAIADLREALQAYVEAFGLEDALARVNSPTALRDFEIELDEPVRA